VIKLSLLFYMLSAADPNTDIITLLSKASVPTVLAVIVVGAMREWWVPGTTHRRTVRERDALLNLALQGQEVGNKALDAASILAAAAAKKRGE
jgi:hypothetical protein